MGTDNAANAPAKHVQVRRMFDSIAPAYDLMNRMMTLGIDKLWRRRTVKALAAERPEQILDIATGTGDLALALARKCPGASVYGIDISQGMIDIGRKKIDNAGLANRISLSVADALNLPFADNSFDAISVAYGVRNFEHLDKGFSEMLRVLRPGGKVFALELTPPASKFIKPFYNFYTRHIIPAVGRMVSHDARAYSYLPRSIAAVPARQQMTRLLSQAGFADAAFRSMTFGVCTLYTARKP